MCVLHQFNRQTYPILKVDRDQIQLREYVLTRTETKLQCDETWINTTLPIFNMMSETVECSFIFKCSI